MPWTSEPAADDAGSSGEPVPSRTRDWRLIGETAVLAVVVAGLDQLTKVWAETALADGRSVRVLGELIQFRLLYNPGAAFSIATGMTWLLTLVVVVVVAMIARAATRIGSRTWAAALGLLLGGAVGNLVDRLFRAPGFPEGHVVDFIAYGGLFVGNLADIAIVAAAVLIAGLTFRGVGLDGKRKPPPSGRGEHRRTS